MSRSGESPKVSSLKDTPVTTFGWPPLSGGMAKLHFAVMCQLSGLKCWEDMEPKHLEMFGKARDSQKSGKSTRRKSTLGRVKRVRRGKHTRVSGE